MELAVTIGLDLGKSVFQVHGVDAGGAVVVQRRLTRGKLLGFFAKQPPCLVGMEACAAAHHWGRELSKLGHAVRLMPPNYVKPYVKRQKNDAADAEAICEAVTRPHMRFVEIKTCEQQGTLVLHRVRLMLMRQRVQLSNAIRGHMAEYGLVAPVGRNGLQRLIAILGNPDDDRVPAMARASLAPLVCQFGLVNDQVLENDRRVRASARSTELGCRLMEVPGVGPVLASAMVATVPDPTAFKSGRDLAAWIGLVPAAELQRRQGEARRHHQAGRPISAPAVGGWSPGCHPLRSEVWNQAPVAGASARPPIAKDRRCRAGQQDGQDDLGHDDDRGTI
jgi:transposase